MVAPPLVKSSEPAESGATVGSQDQADGQAGDLRHCPHSKQRTEYEDVGVPAQASSSILNPAATAKGLIERLVGQATTHLSVRDQRLRLVLDTTVMTSACCFYHGGRSHNSFMTHDSFHTKACYRCCFPGHGSDVNTVQDMKHSRASGRATCGRLSSRALP